MSELEPKPRKFVIEVPKDEMPPRIKDLLLTDLGKQIKTEHGPYVIAKYTIKGDVYYIHMEALEDYVARRKAEDDAVSGG